jgi:hypothetical protein
MRIDEATNTFYNSIGWRTIAGDWENLRRSASAYVSACRMRVARHIPPSGDSLLDMASGSIQYPEYLTFSHNYKKRYCVDLSLDALKNAENRIGTHGVYLHGDFLDMEMDRDFFDCSISLHTIYHIDKEYQEKAVRKLIDVTKSGHPVIVVYSNPNVAPIIPKVVRLLSILTQIVRKLLPRMNARKESTSNSPSASLEPPPCHPYYYVHPLEWWQQFSDAAAVDIYPWRSLTADLEKLAFPDNYIGQLMFAILFRLEELFPQFFVKNFHYPMIVLTKK